MYDYSDQNPFNMNKNNTLYAFALWAHEHGE